jgi:GNAT superfamily N-acetyltransferase
MDFTFDRKPSAAEFRELLVRSTLSERRPIDDADCLQGMLDHADLIATCWIEDRLIGIARSVTDYHYCCYLSDLAVDQEFQRRGIGARLIALTRTRLHAHCKIILLSAPAASGYYPHIGFVSHPSAWILPTDQAVKTNSAP